MVDSTSSINQLLDIMKALRDPESGCPWDIEQTFKTIAAYTVEEAYEVADAIDRMDMHDLKDELGDLLFQVVYHAQMADEQGDFVFDDVVKNINEKLIRRHPQLHLQKLIVSEAGASVYSASALAADEFPELDVSLRGAVSIARRLQDPR